MRPKVANGHSRLDSAHGRGADRHHCREGQSERYNEIAAEFVRLTYAKPTMVLLRGRKEVCSIERKHTDTPPNSWITSEVSRSSLDQAPVSDAPSSNVKWFTSHRPQDRGARAALHHGGYTA